jgi:beta-galactosidase
LQETPLAVAVSGPDFALLLGKQSGAIESFSVDGREMVAAPLIPNFWRAQTDNDSASKNLMRQQLGIWTNAGPARVIVSTRAQQTSPQHVSVAVAGNLLAGQVDLELHYDIFGNGDVRVRMKIIPNTDLPELPRVGLQMAMPASFDTMTWLGRGPHENYCDRRTGAAVGLYSGKVQDLVHAYVRPQENGNRTDVRWVALTDANGQGLLALAGSTRLNASAWPYFMTDLEQAKHIQELPTRSIVTVNLDYGQRGLGGINSWGAQPLSQYTLPARIYDYSFVLRPLKTSPQNLLEITRRPCPTPRN